LVRGPPAAPFYVHVDNNQNANILGNNANRLEISVSVQNVRSMNISTKNDITTQKIICICSLKTDFIFLSDLRLNTARQVSAVHDLEKNFAFNGYKFIHNSTIPSRGVGILIKKNIFDNLTIIERINSEDCNSLLLHVQFRNKNFVLCPIYGPNRDNESTFYDELSIKLRNFACPLIVGGDWNATLDGSNVHTNLDVINMRNIPSILRTNKVKNLCREFSLVDPFRLIYPNKKEYTFIPTSINEHNRSRLDFFLISNCIYGTGTSIKIPNSLTSTLFDHKPVLLSLDTPKILRKNIVKDTILHSIDLPAFVKAAVFECYLQHYTPIDGVLNGINQPTMDTVQQYLNVIGRILTFLSEIRELEKGMAINGYNERDDLFVSAKRADINLMFEDMPDLAYF